MKEYINFKISFGGKICNFLSLYRSPGQLSNTSEHFADNFELNLDKIANKISICFTTVNQGTNSYLNRLIVMYLLFTSQHNFVMESGIHSSLHQNCHHQIIYAKINLKVCYLPPYERVLWHYQGGIKFNEQLDSF